MTIQAFKPQSELLRNHIECYYFITRSKNDSNFRYNTFPSTNSILSITSGKIESHSKARIVFKGLSGSLFNAILTKPFEKPIEVEYISELSEITVYFKPLSIFNFIDKSDHKFVFKDDCVFLRYNTFESAFTDILNDRNIENKINTIESYFISRYKEFEIRYAKSALQLLSTANDTRISTISDELNISRKTLNSVFNKYLGRTPSTYRKIVRFRNSFNVKSDTLTSLAFKLGFFDQAHMIKEFKGITGTTPRSFFGKTRTIESNSIKWLIDE